MTSSKRDLNIAVSIICFFLLRVVLLRLLMFHELPKSVSFKCNKMDIRESLSSLSLRSVYVGMWVTNLCTYDDFLFFVTSINHMPTLKLNQMLIITGDWRLLPSVLLLLLLLVYYAFWMDNKHTFYFKRRKKLFINPSRMMKSTIIMPSCVWYFSTDSVALSSLSISKQFWVNKRWQQIPNIADIIKFNL